LPRTRVASGFSRKALQSGATHHEPRDEDHPDL
jgi:hypothetical protein